MTTATRSSAANTHASRAVAFWQAFTSDTKRPRFVFGRNIYTEELLKVVKFDAVIDDFSPVGSLFRGLPVIRSTEISKDAMVIAASGGKPLTVRRLLTQLGVENIDYFAISRHAAPQLRSMMFNEDFPTEYLHNQSKYDRLMQSLADETSRETIEKLIRFRLSCDLDNLEGFTDRQAEQYFENFLDLREHNEVFIDVGCYDGATTLEFCARYPAYKQVFAFEPDPDNFVKCTAAFRGLEKVSLIAAAAGDGASKARLSKHGSASAINSSGDIDIAVVRIDDTIGVAPTLIKIDTEGGEAACLRGGRRVIAMHAPRLAVAAYHKPGDFWAIPELVRGMHGDYRLFARHYTESIYETVLFFVPSARS